MTKYEPMLLRLWCVCPKDYIFKIINKLCCPVCQDFIFQGRGYNVILTERLREMGYLREMF